MKASRKIDFTWGLLILLTIASAMLGKAFESSVGVTIVVAGLVFFKGLLVIENFLEIRDTPPAFRRSVRFYLVFWTLLIVFGYVFAPEIARITQV